MFVTKSNKDREADFKKELKNAIKNNPNILSSLKGTAGINGTDGGRGPVKK